MRILIYFLSLILLLLFLLDFNQTEAKFSLISLDSCNDINTSYEDLVRAIKLIDRLIEKSNRFSLRRKFLHSIRKCLKDHLRFKKHKHHQTKQSTEMPTTTTRTTTTTTKRMITTEKKTTQQSKITTTETPLTTFRSSNKTPTTTKKISMTTEKSTTTIRTTTTTTTTPRSTTEVTHSTTNPSPPSTIDHNEISTTLVPKVIDRTVKPMPKKFHCPNASGYFPHTNCWMFWQCTNDEAKALECPKGTQWNQKVLVCTLQTDCNRP
ncbi:peritrophin [Sarcoptes scabiei]|nr:peritrophin [Sarcoptes scabiei]